MGAQRSSITAFRHLAAQDQMCPKSGGREGTQPWVVLVCVLRMRTNTGSHGCTASRVRRSFTGLREQEGRTGGWLPRQHRTSCGGQLVIYPHPMDSRDKILEDRQGLKN